MGQSKILIIGIGFYNYEQAIVDNLKKRGYEVDYMISVYRSKLMSLCSKFRLQNRIQDYYLSNEINKLTKSYDIILIIKGEGFHKHHIQQLKKGNPAAKFVLYLWDSMERLDNAQILIDGISTIYTFDRIDAIRYNLKFRPLFFLKSNIEPQTDNIKYAVFFLGWLHSDRYQLVSSIRRQLRQHNISYKFLIYTGRLRYFIDRYIKKIIRKDDSDMFIFSPIGYNEYIKYCIESNVILDIAHPNQNGLTMRTIEAIGLNKRLITTNKDVANYPTINNVCQIIDRSNPIIDVDFIKGINTSAISDNLYYTLNTFIDDILSTI